MKKVIFFIGLLCSFTVFSDTSSPVGTWLTIDDATGKEKSVVEVYEQDGELQGKVIEILTPPVNPKGHICDKCSGDRKDQDIKGMVILWGYKKSGSKWSGGEILDPKNGKIYSSNMSLGDNGKTLFVRGYIGISLIGRTQTWHRKE